METEMKVIISLCSYSTRWGADSKVKDMVFDVTSINPKWLPYMVEFIFNDYGGSYPLEKYINHFTATQQTYIQEKIDATQYFMSAFTVEFKK